ncbi:MAG: hypothetical protein EOO19_00475 [Chryseobacterium sp.]|nr:MAG: hypothetical protein EOO19_00475 [Chryseobacterium sp.]
MTIQIAILSLIILFTAELMYFQIASRFNIIDQPNHRSSHTSITIRGGGIIFPIAVILWWVFNDFANSYFVLALIALSVISFIDDLVDLNRLVRLSVHLTAVLLLFFEWSLYSLAFYWLFIAAIFVIATINAYNFMDGINGILGAYSLVVLASLFYINNSIQFTDSNLILIAFMAVLVFNFFNFRKKGFSAIFNSVFS